MDAKQVNDEIRGLVDRWCERRELAALASLLPAWLYNDGLTTGWSDLAAALRSTSTYRTLPDAEREQLKRLFVVVDLTLRQR
ncbi:MAG TPA: hypothetical protein VHY91_02520 [Pirellulales bacterium]|jgi:hypothetical protein|nr:hypothetical protein [Pirellulales bacterium]